MNAREAALRTLVRGERAPATLDDVLDGADLPARERALATELVSGTTKMQRALAWSLEPYLRRPLESLGAELRWTLLMSAYQLLYLTKIPAHAAVNEAVALARRVGHAGTAGFANAVLRKLAADPRTPPRPQPGAPLSAFADWASLPEWIAEHYIARFGFEQAIEIAAGINDPARRGLRVNTLRWSRDEAAQKLEVHGFVVAEGTYGIPECLIVADAAHGDRVWLREALERRDLVVQSEESQLAVHLLDPKPGEKVLDVCAGRGVKTGQIAARMRASGTLVSVDDDERKLGDLEISAKRAGFVVRVITADAGKALPADMQRDADAVLVDAPCTALGVLGRRADARWRKKPGDPQRFARVQSAILRNAAQAVRLGGRLLYATCSTHPVEDEAVVDRFLADHVGWTARQRLLTTPGIGGNDGFFHALLERRTSDG